MRELSQRTVLITGAAAGIGRATALAFARQGAHLVAVDIDAAGLTSLQQAAQRHSVECRTATVDVSDWSAVDALGDELEQAGVAVDVLINNAGVLVGGFIADTSLETWRWLLGINLWGPIHFLRRFLPAMQAKRQGHVVNVASAAGIIGFPTIGAYSATKFAVVGLTQALRAELALHEIGVTAVCPGIISNTNLLTTARTERIDGNQAAPLVHRGSSPDVVANAIVDAVRHNRAQIFPGWLSEFGYLMHRAAPPLVRTAIGQFARFAKNRAGVRQPRNDA